MMIAAKLARKLRDNPTAMADDAADLLLSQDMQISKLKYALTKIADGNDPLTVVRSIAQQALVKR